MHCSPPVSSVLGFSEQEYWSGLSFPIPGGSSLPKDQTQVSDITCIGKSGSLPPVPPGKPKPLAFLCLCACVLSCFSHVQLLAALWTIACQAPLTMEFSRQEYWSGLPSPSPGDLPNSGRGLNQSLLWELRSRNVGDIGTEHSTNSSVHSHQG